ncbi:GIY-YIG nuclease family protein [Cyclobacterium sp. GBPx2]|uniref:GIY-YIG nuclease family protein n=1 Tax=Cyclobacterium plantarum TaxID=2716263 RepID=A0ABX0HEH0_9BACT|nr:GIY-YIG nuclease family protein [Cyclobacterium plantarum]
MNKIAVICFNIYATKIGFTQDLKLRIEQHNDGLVQSTKSRRPLQLIYYEACIENWDAIKREKYLKTHYGRLFFHKRLKTWFESNVV